MTYSVKRLEKSRKVHAQNVFTIGGRIQVGKPGVDHVEETVSGRRPF